MGKIYYKYRSLKDIERFFDILENKRLYASLYKDMNDPMEGFYYNNNLLENIRVEKIKIEKLRNKICSFSGECDSKLMWAHYADSFRGVAIGFETSENVIPVKYDGLYLADNSLNNEILTVNIFHYKLREWKYENEYRVITRIKNHIKIRPTNIIFGLNVPPLMKEHLITSLRIKYTNLILEHQIRRNGNIEIELITNTQ